MKITIAFLAAFTLTLAALLYERPEQEDDVPSYVRGSVELSGSAIQ